MKRKVPLILFSVLISWSVQAQFTYYDAIEIKKNVKITTLTVPGSEGKLEISLPKDTANTSKIIKILGSYLPASAIDSLERTDTTKAYRQAKFSMLQKYFSGNPFFSLKTQVQDTKNLLPGVKINRAAIAGAINKLSGVDVTNYADALAQFMVERAKEELNVAFFQKFKNYLTKNPEIAVLFPETSDFLSNMMAHEYSQLISGLRDSFHEDLKNLLYNLDDVFLLPKYQNVVDEFPEILVVVRSVQIVADLGDNEHPADIIRQFRDMSEWNGIKRPEVVNLHNFIKTTSLVSDAVRYKEGNIDLLTLPVEGKISQTANALTATDGGGRTRELKQWVGDRNWISARHFEMLFKDEVALKIFLGLVYQKAVTDSIAFTIEGESPKMLSDFMANTQSSVFLFRSYFLEFLRLAEQTEDKLIELKGKRKEEITPQEYFEYISAGIDLIEYGFKVANLVDDDFDGTEYVTIMRTGNNLYRNIVEKNYGAAVTNALKIIEWLTEIITEKDRFNNAKAAAITKALPANATDKQKKETEEKIDCGFARFKSLNKLSRGAVKYGVFMANVIDAKSPTDIKEAIRNATLPVGSSSYKKYQRLTLSINSYLGAQVRLDQDDTPNRTWDQNLGVIAPIGPALNHGLGTGGSVSLFAPLLDVGAIAEFRLKDDGTELTESIKLGNIFSPGGYVVYGFPGNIPLALGIGGQYGPGLYEVKSTSSGTGNSYENPSWRWNVFLTVDMPLFNLTPGKKLGSK